MSFLYDLSSDYPTTSWKQQYSPSIASSYILSPLSSTSSDSSDYFSIATKSSGAITKKYRDIGSGLIELRFSLDHFTSLQKTALGIRGIHNLLLILPRKDASAGFCLHLDPDPSFHKKYQSSHKLCRISSTIPDALPCRGLQNGLTYQVSRSLFRYLKKNLRNASPTSIYDFVINLLDKLPKSCTTCGRSQPATLYRPTACSSTCQSLASRVSSSGHLYSYLQDPLTIELLLTAIHAGSQSSSLGLAPPLPHPFPTSHLTITSTLRHFPPVSALRNRDLRTSFPPSAQQLLATACTTYRGFILSLSSSSSSPFHIPGLPRGTVEFLLADAGPKLEAQFELSCASAASIDYIRRPSIYRSLSGSHLDGPYFYGTSMDRLYAILTRGLQVLRGEEWIRHGRKWGEGVYLTDSPSEALGYAGKSKGQGQRIGRTLVQARSRDRERQMMWGDYGAGGGEGVKASGCVAGWGEILCR